MYRILIFCLLGIQVQSRAFGTFFFGGRASPILPWLSASPSSIAPSPHFPAAGIFDTIRIHQNVYSPFSRYLSSVNTLRQMPQFPPRIYGRLETQSPLAYQQFYGPTAPSFIPSNAFNQVDQHNQFSTPNYQFPADSFVTNNGPQFAPVPYAGTTAPALYGQPHQVYGPPPTNTFNAPNGEPNRFEPSNPIYNLPGQNPFQPQLGTQLPVASFATNVLPIIPHINSQGTTYLPPVTQKVDTIPLTTPTTNLETNANESAQIDTAKLPTVVRDGTQTTVGNKVSSAASEATTTETSIVSTSPLSTTAQLSEATAETSSIAVSLIDTDNTNASESTAAISNQTSLESSSTESYPTESSPTESSSTESSPTESFPTESSPTESSPKESSPTDDDSNAV